MLVNIESLSQKAKLVFLARLAHEITICARGTYEAGTAHILEPDVLRSYNELLHHIAGALIHAAEGEEPWLKQIFEEMRTFGEMHNQSGEIGWAVQQVMRRPLE